MHKARGALIVLEGLDGVGKSTQAKLIVERLLSKGIPAKLMMFPDRTTATGKVLDQYLKQSQELSDQAVHLLFSANRWEVAKSMEQQLLDGTTLVLDRYSDSGVAYSFSKGLELSWCRNSDAGLPRPDVVLFLDRNVPARSESSEYGHERYEKELFQQQVRATFEQLKQNYWQIISTDGKSIEEVQGELQQYVSRAINQNKDRPIEKL